MVELRPRKDLKRPRTLLDEVNIEPTPRPKKKKLSASNPNSTTDEEEFFYYGAFSGAGTDIQFDPIAFLEAGQRASNGGTLHCYFLAMGQGDCTVLVTPTNDLFIIDIGTDGSEHNWGGISVSSGILRNVLRQPNIAGSNKRLKGLILTHSDSDHSNKIGILESMGISVEQVFHSDTIESYSVQSILETLTKEETNKGEINDISILGVSYTTGQDNPSQLTFKQAQQTYGTATAESIINLIKNKKTGVLEFKDKVSPVGQYHAFRNGKNKALYDVPKDRPITMVDGDTPAIPYYYTADDGVVIYDEGGCKIRLLVANYRNSLNAYMLSKPDDSESKYEILDRQGNYKSFNKKLYDEDWEKNYNKLSVSNVTETRGNAFDANRASIILHISYNGEDYVICGDATGDTLNMVRYQYPHLQNVTILQSPHHGSDTNGSESSDFALTMNPMIAVISTPYNKTGHRHPRKVNASNYTKPGRRNYDNTIKSSYGWWTNNPGNDEIVQIDRGLSYCQYKNQPYRLFMTGWMDDGYYHYTAPFNSDGNKPNFRQTVPGRPVNDADAS